MIEYFDKKLLVLLVMFVITLQCFGAPPDIEIISAKYGTKVVKVIDVTDIVRKEYKTNGGKIVCDCGLFGDPAVGFYKTLTAEIKYKGKNYNLNVEEGGEIPVTEKYLEDPRRSLSLIQRMAEDAYAQGKHSVKIPAGVYRIHRPVGASFHISFSNMKDFEIDATGSTVILEDRNNCGIRFQYCRNVTFKGATLTRDLPPFSQGVIKAIAKDRSYLDIEIDKGYPTDMDSPEFKNTPCLTFYNPNGIIKKNGASVWRQKTIEHLNGRLYRFHVLPFGCAANVGDLVAWRRMAPSSLGEISVFDCSRCALKNVTIKNYIMLGIYELNGDGDNYFNFTTTYADPPKGATRKPLLAGAADGFHSQGVRKGAALDKCLIEGCHDDGVNIHGGMWPIASIHGNSVEVQTNALPRAGDVFHFYDNNNSLIGNAAIVSFQQSPTSFTAKFDKEVPKSATRACNMDSSGVGFTIKDSITRNHRARGFMVRPGGTIENCVAEDVYGGGIVVTPEFNEFSEGPYAQNMVIRGNTVRRVGLAPSWNNGAITIEYAGNNSNGFPYPGGHRNILIENNRFEDNDGPNLMITSAIGVTVKNNTFVNPMHNKIWEFSIGPNNALAIVTSASDVKFEGNKVINPGEFMKKTVSAAPSAKNVSGKKDGFVVK